MVVLAPATTARRCCLSPTISTGVALMSQAPGLAPGQDVEHGHDRRYRLSPARLHQAFGRGVCHGVGATTRLDTGGEPLVSVRGLRSCSVGGSGGSVVIRRVSAVDGVDLDIAPRGHGRGVAAAAPKDPRSAGPCCVDFRFRGGGSGFRAGRAPRPSTATSGLASAARNSGSLFSLDPPCASARSSPNDCARAAMAPGGAIDGWRVDAAGGSGAYGACKRWPHDCQAVIGSRSRIARRALVRQHAFVVADEPVSALDMTIPGPGAELFARLQLQ